MTCWIWRAIRCGWEVSVCGSARRKDDLSAAAGDGAGSWRKSWRLRVSSLRCVWILSWKASHRCAVGKREWWSSVFRWRGCDRREAISALSSLPRRAHALRWNKWHASHWFIEKVGRRMMIVSLRDDADASRQA